MLEEPPVEETVLQLWSHAGRQQQRLVLPPPQSPSQASSLPAVLFLHHVSLHTQRRRRPPLQQHPFPRLHVPTNRQQLLRPPTTVQLNTKPPRRVLPQQQLQPRSCRRRYKM